MITNDEDKLQAIVSYSSTANRQTQSLIDAAVAASQGSLQDQHEAYQFFKNLTDSVVEANSELTTDVVIAFRGSVHQINWNKHNLKQKMVTSCEAENARFRKEQKTDKDSLPHGAGFHEGYRCVAWPALRESVFATIDDLMAPDNRDEGHDFPFWQDFFGQVEEGEEPHKAPLMRSPVRKLRFHFTGHSMGAGIATIAGLDLHGVLSDRDAFEKYFPVTVAALKVKAEKEEKDEDEVIEEYRKQQRLASITAVGCSGVMDKVAHSAMEEQFNGKSEQSKEWQRAVMTEKELADDKKGENKGQKWIERFVRLEHDEDMFVHLTPEIKLLMPDPKEKMAGKLIKIMGNVFDEDKGKMNSAHDPKYYIQGMQNNYVSHRIEENKRYSNAEL